jgi:hypothetical protein
MPHVDHDTELSTHEENAESIRHDLQRMARRIRGFTLLTTERRRRVVVSGHVDDDYLRNVALLLDQHADLAITARLTAEEIRRQTGRSQPGPSVIPQIDRQLAGRSSPTARETVGGRSVVLRSSTAT